MEFNDVAIEARQFFAHYKMLGYGLNIVHTLKTLDTKRMKFEGKLNVREEVEIPIPFKILGISDASEDNFDWISPQNLFDKSSKPRRKERGDSEPCIGRIQCIYDKLANLDLKGNDGNT